MKIQINGQNGHRCKAKQEGDEAVFTCPKCPEYERRLNLKTGKMTVKGGDGIRHHGFYVKAGLDTDLYNPN